MAVQPLDGILWTSENKRATATHFTLCYIRLSDRSPRLDTIGYPGYKSKKHGNETILV